MFKTNPQLEIMTEALTQLLKAATIGETVLYSDMQAATGPTDRETLRRAMHKARDIVEADGVARFAVSRGNGLKRLASSEFSSIGAEVRSSIRRKATKGFQRLSDIRANDLSSAESARIQAERSILGAVAELSKTSAARKIEKGTQTGPMIAAEVFKRLNEQA